MTEIDLNKYTYHPGIDEVGDIDLDETPIFINGARYTEADAERDALIAEQELRKGLIPGGKSLSGGSRHSPRFQVILGEDTAEKVKAAAQAKHMSVSKWIRRTIEEKVA